MRVHLASELSINYRLFVLSFQVPKRSQMNAAVEWVVCCFVFQRPWVHVSARKPAILTL